MGHILVTGGTGLIGTSLIQKLSNQDTKITVLTRDEDAAKNKFTVPVEFIHSLNQLSTLNDIDIVINLAGEPIVNKRWSDSQKHLLQKSRWETTQQLVTLIEKSDNPPHTLISGSAIGIYGRQNNQKIDESFEQHYEEFSHTLCQRWENIALDAQSDNTRVCILRTGIVLSDRGGALSKMTLPFKLGLGGPIGNGEHYMSWIHIDDMVRGIMFLVEQPVSKGIYNFTAPNPVSNRELSKALANAVNRPCLLFTPKAALKLAMGEMADLLIYGQNVIPKRLMDENFTFLYKDIDEAFASLAL